MRADRAPMGLSVQGLGFNFGAKRALAEVSFDIAPGSFCALLGPNGAGKSTLIALLTRLLVAPYGKITIAGHDLATNPLASLAALGVVFQQSTIELNLTVRQNLRYFAALHGLAGAALEKRIDVALERLEMRERAGERARNLNGGHRRRMEIARALLHEPKILLLDEPTVGIDAATRAAITQHVHELAEDGMSILWATHLTDEVRDADRLLILHQGKILEDGLAGNIRGDATLSDRFFALTKGAS